MLIIEKNDHNYYFTMPQTTTPSLTSKILHLRSSVKNNVPTLGILDLGQIAINTVDGILFTKAKENNIETLKKFLPSDQLPLSFNNTLSSITTTVGNNENTGYMSSILGGMDNVIFGSGSVIVGGESNSLSGDYSFALGTNLSGSASNYTYVNNLSSQGNIHGALIPKVKTISQTSYTVTGSDVGSILRITSGSACTITVPNDSTENLPIGTEIKIVNTINVTSSVYSSNNYISSANGLGILSKGSTLLMKIAANEWFFSGDTVVL